MSFFRKKAIGIDFGTTYSSIFIYNKTIKSPEGKNDGPYGIFIPTIIAYKKINRKTEYFFGNKAREKSNFVVDIKRMLGISYNSSLIDSIKDELLTKGIGIRSIENKKGDYPKEIVQIELKDPNTKTSVWHTPEELAGKYLKWLIEVIADTRINANLQVVITIPADFSSNQRKSILKAAEIANIRATNVTLLYEPSAAAFCFIEQSEIKQFNKLLVCGFGGGTLDLSLLKITESSFEVTCVGGDRFLGGRDFDQKILNWAIAKFNDKGINTRMPKIKKQLDKKCIIAKEELSENDGTDITLVYDGEELDAIIQITRDEFNNECKNLIERCSTTVQAFINKQHIDKSLIDGVLLVGGSSKMPIFVEKMKEIFGASKILDFDKKRESIGMGACYLASMKCNMASFRFINNQNLNQKLPHSIGLQDGIDGFTPFLIKNQEIPVGPKTLIFETLSDYQELAIFKIYEGESPKISSGINELVGEFQFNNLPKKPKGQVKFNITMSIDEFGILNVSCNSPQAGKIDDYKQELDLTKLETFKLIISQNQMAPKGSKKIETATRNRELRSKAPQTVLKRNPGPRSC